MDSRDGQVNGYTDRSTATVLIPPGMFKLVMWSIQGMSSSYR